MTELRALPLIQFPTSSYKVRDILGDVEIKKITLEVTNGRIINDESCSLFKQLLSPYRDHLLQGKTLNEILALIRSHPGFDKELAQFATTQITSYVESLQSPLNDALNLAINILLEKLVGAVIRDTDALLNMAPKHLRIGVHDIYLTLYTVKPWFQLFQDRLPPRPLVIFVDKLQYTDPYYSVYSNRGKGLTKIQIEALLKLYTENHSHETAAFNTLCSCLEYINQILRTADDKYYAQLVSLLPTRCRDGNLRNQLEIGILNLICIRLNQIVCVQRKRITYQNMIDAILNNPGSTLLRTLILSQSPNEPSLFVSRPTQCNTSQQLYERSIPMQVSTSVKSVPHIRINTPTVPKSPSRPVLSPKSPPIINKGRNVQQLSPVKFSSLVTDVPLKAPVITIMKNPGRHSSPVVQLQPASPRGLTPSKEVTRNTSNRPPIITFNPTSKPHNSPTDLYNITELGVTDKDVSSTSPNNSPPNPYDITESDVTDDDGSATDVDKESDAFYSIVPTWNVDNLASFTKFSNDISMANGYVPSNLSASYPAMSPPRISSHSRSESPMSPPRISSPSRSGSPMSPPRISSPSRSSSPMSPPRISSPSRSSSPMSPPRISSPSRSVSQSQISFTMNSSTPSRVSSPFPIYSSPSRNIQSIYGISHY
jgi:hypothetical protein